MAVRDTAMRCDVASLRCSTPGRDRSDDRSWSGRLALLAVVVVVMASGCNRGEGRPDPDPAAAEDRIISNVWQTDAPDVLEVGWFATACETFDSIDVNETIERVDLRLRSYVDPDNCSEPGTTSVTVDLQDPVGDRVVWDANPFVNDTVLVEPPR